MARPLCDVCRQRPAEIRQPHTGLKLCWKCFREQIVRRVRLEIRRWRLFEPRHRLLLALSGGKDSFTLLDTLAEIHDTSKMVALTILEGIPGGYHIAEMETISRYARQYGVDHVKVTFKEFYGADLSEIVERAKARGLEEKPCTFCGVFRRRIMEEYARALGVDRVVTAHNLDDEAQTAIMNILRGDYVGLVRLHPLAALATQEFVPRVKPLRKIYEWETTTYAFRSGYPLQDMECPYLYLSPTLRLRVRLVAYRVESERPGSLLKLLEALDVLLEPAAKAMAERPVKLSRCRLCGAPTAPGRSVCKVCELLQKVGLPAPPAGLSRLQQILQPGSASSPTVTRTGF